MPDFTSVTEQPGIRTTRDGIAMLHTRYTFAAGFCEGKSVLEIACGAGMGLGLLAGKASRVVGGDVDETLLLCARRHYRDRIPVLQFDAHSLPFCNASFDVILLFEAIYYLSSPVEFLRECRCVLRAGGILLICTANPEIPGFNPSPFSKRYFQADELQDLLTQAHFVPELRVAFPLSNATLRDRTVTAIRSAAVRLRLFPKTMKGKQALKRMFYGRLSVVSPELQDDASSTEFPEPLPTNKNPARYRVLFAIGRC